ncbi:hypothetical protein FAZ95_36100 [Trinickia violacea]|uniref:Uncharacterized protein n=1 Tax=Trinickia violacea TaxID=2571746 RepID=A0A4P8J0Q3_9BURK|nr:hypothetical protein [Trinickia violacea]QCP54366.1 hypothetical protein FAZ95_36100 [Trinickia violacea]
MVNDALYEFAFSPQYQKCLDEVCKRTGILIYAQYGDVIFKFDKGRVEVSGMSLRDIEALVQTYNDTFINFCVAKIEFFKKNAVGQEFPKGEEVEEFDQKEQVQGFSRGILLMYAIEFLLAAKGREHLEEYVKTARIPHAKKYVKDILDLIKLSG